jgi:hypothetical protein
LTEDIHKEDIPREFVNLTLLPKKVSIWGIVQLVKYGAVDFSLMPKDIKAKVDAELDKRYVYEIYEAKITLSELLEIKEVYETAVRDKHIDWKECEEYLPFLIQEIERLQEKIRRKN